jgi:hypothetical protein
MFDRFAKVARRQGGKLSASSGLYQVTWQSDAKFTVTIVLLQRSALLRNTQGSDWETHAKIDTGWPHENSHILSYYQSDHANWMHLFPAKI